MVGDTRPSFNSHPSWVSYRAIVEKEFGIGLPETITEHWMPIRGSQIRFDEWLPAGEVNGTLICVHGAGGNGRMLAPFAQVAAKQGWRVLAPDLPGYGLSIQAVDSEWDYAEWPKIVAELAQMQEGPVVLLGASMGGLTAVYAAQELETLKGVAVTTLIDLSDPANFALGARAKWLGWMSILGFKLIPWLVDRIWLPLSLAAPLKAMSSNARVQHYFQSDSLLGRKWLPVKFWRSVYNFKREGLAMKCPLFLVHPGEDDWTPLSISEDKLAEIDAPKAIKVLTNGSHLPLEQPAFDELCEALGDFLADKGDTIPTEI